MKNKTLEELTKRAEAACDHLPRMVLRGDGELIEVCQFLSGNPDRVMSNEQLHRRVHAALQEMLVVRNTLREYPRNKARTPSAGQG